MSHTALRVTPATMLFRDDKHIHFPRKPITEDCIRELETKIMIRKEQIEL